MDAPEEVLGVSYEMDPIESTNRFHARVADHKQYIIDMMNRPQLLLSPRSREYLTNDTESTPIISSNQHFIYRRNVGFFLNFSND